MLNVNFNPTLSSHNTLQSLTLLLVFIPRYLFNFWFIKVMFCAKWQLAWAVLLFMPTPSPPSIYHHRPKWYWSGFGQGCGPWVYEGTVGISYCPSFPNWISALNNRRVEIHFQNLNQLGSSEKNMLGTVYCMRRKWSLLCYFYFLAHHPSKRGISVILFRI